MYSQMIGLLLLDWILDFVSFLILCHCVPMPFSLLLLLLLLVLSLPFYSMGISRVTPSTIEGDHPPRSCSIHNMSVWIRCWTL